MLVLISSGKLGNGIRKGQKSLGMMLLHHIDLVKNEYKHRVHARTPFTYGEWKNTVFSLG